MRYAQIKATEQFELMEGALTVKRNPVIRMTHVGVCGTDLSSWRDGDHYKGLVIGHEYAGLIEEPNDSGFQKGDRVVGYTQNIENEPCGHCERCLAEDFDHCTNRRVYTWKGGEEGHPGAYSQLTTWFSKSIFKLPDSVSNEAAALIEPMAVGLHAVELTHIEPCDKILVLGGGIIGLGVAEWARVLGAEQVTITELSPKKREIIRNFGVAEQVLDAAASDLKDQLMEVSKGGYDIVFDCAGVAQAVNLGIHVLKNEKGKKFTGIALPHRDLAMDYRTLVLQEVVFRGSKGHRPCDFKMALNAIANGKLHPTRYISRRIPFEQLQEGFEQMKREGDSEIKAMLIF